MTLIELVTQATDELAIPRPSAVASSLDAQVRQMYALINRLGDDICRQFEWQRLDKEYILTTVAITTTGTLTAGSAVITGIPTTAALSSNFGLSGVGVRPFAQIVTVDNMTQVTMNMTAETSGTVDLVFSQVQYPLPSDWLKQIPQTEWDRTNRWPLMGPQSPQDWQSFKSGIVYAGPRNRFRILGNTITLNPMPPDGLVFAYEYISTSWAISGTGVSKTRFTADDDTCIFPDSLMVTGLKAQWKLAKGLNADADLGEFRTLLEQCKSYDKSAPKLSLSPYGGSILMSGANIPDGNWIGP